MNYIMWKTSHNTRWTMWHRYEKRRETVCGVIVPRDVLHVRETEIPKLVSSRQVCKNCIRKKETK